MLSGFSFHPNSERQSNTILTEFKSVVFIQGCLWNFHECLQQYSILWVIYLLWFPIDPIETGLFYAGLASCGLDLFLFEDRSAMSTKKHIESMLNRIPILSKLCPLKSRNLYSSTIAGSFLEGFLFIQNHTNIVSNCPIKN